MWRSTFPSSSPSHLPTPNSSSRWHSVCPKRIQSNRHSLGICADCWCVRCPAYSFRSAATKCLRRIATRSLRSVARGDSAMSVVLASPLLLLTRPDHPHHRTCKTLPCRWRTTVRRTTACAWSTAGGVGGGPLDNHFPDHQGRLKHLRRNRSHLHRQWTRYCDFPHLSSAGHLLPRCLLRRCCTCGMLNLQIREDRVGDKCNHRTRW